MNATFLKILAIIFMLIDHIGAFLFPKILVFRLIGRLAFPIFAYFIAEGYRKTSDLTSYFGRLFAFALISQLPFSMATGSKTYLNIFFTLALGLYAIYIYDKRNDLRLVYLIAVLAQYANTDYGFFGVMLIFIFHKYRDNFKEIVKWFFILTIAFQVMIDVNLASLGFKEMIAHAGFYQFLWMGSLVFLKQYNGEKGRGLKYLFYLFYPIHLAIIAIIRNYLR